MTTSTSGAITKMLMIFLLVGLAISPALHAGTLDSSIISMFPKDVGELEYADLSGARQLSWAPQFDAQVVPDCVSGFENFIESAHLGLSPSIDQAAWARVSISGSKQLVVVGVGQFDVETIRLFLDSRGASSIPAGPYFLYASQTDLGMSEGYFTLIDSATIVFGTPEGLRRILELRAGGEGSLSGNAKMMNLIKQVNTDAVFWSALDSADAKTAVQHLVPEMMKFPQANDLVGKLKELLISVRAPEEVQLDFRADSGSPSDAIILSQLLEAGMLSKRYQVSRDHPELVKLMEGITLSPYGSHLDIYLSMTEDQMLVLVDRNTFGLLK